MRSFAKIRPFGASESFVVAFRDEETRDYAQAHCVEYKTIKEKDAPKDVGYWNPFVLKYDELSKDK